MKNSAINKIMYTAFIILLIFSSISTVPSMWPSAMHLLSQPLQQQSIQFKLLNGSNRLNEAKNLLSLFDNRSEIKMFNKQYTIFNHQYSTTDIIKVLGTPNKQLPTQLIYYLSDDTTHKLLILLE